MRQRRDESKQPLAEQLGIRLSADDLARLDRVAAALASRVPGVAMNRSATARAAILRGLDTLEAEFGLRATRTPRPARKVR